MSNNARPVRTFIALPLPDSYQTLPGECADVLKGLVRSRPSWTKPGNLHITLKFLGDTAPDLIDALQQSLASIQWRSFMLQVGAGGFFPSKGTPRVLWAGLAQGAKECGVLAKQVEEALVPQGFVPEDRPFRAHLTLARIKKSFRDDPWIEALKRMKELSREAIHMDRFELIKSELTPRGPVYSTLAEFPAQPE